MPRASSHLPPIVSPTLSAIRLSLFPVLNLLPSPSSTTIHAPFSLAPLQTLRNDTHVPRPLYFSSLSLKLVSEMACHPHPNCKASFSSGGSYGRDREILVQHLLIEEDDLKLLSELQKRISDGEDLSDLAVECSICPSKANGGMLGWVKKGQMVPDFEEAAFNAPIDKVVKCKTKFGLHLLQVLSEREESTLQDIQPDELYVKMHDPTFLEEAQLIDVREPEEVAQASLPGFQVLPLCQFGNWGPKIANKFDPEKDTYVLCHHGMRSLQVAKWLQTQGFKRVFNVSGGIHAYAVKADPSVPIY